MKNVLLVFSHEVTDVHSFERIINGFEQQGYSIHEFGGIDSEDFSIDLLPLIIANVYEHEGEIQRLVVLSNVLELVCTWYRCYNGLVSDFVYFIEAKKNNIFKEDNTFYFFRKLADFSGISGEQLEGKIYLNLNFDNYHHIFKFLLKDNYYSFFADFAEFDYKISIMKQPVKKEYYYRKDAYVLEYPADYTGEQRIELDAPTEQLVFDYTTLNQNSYFIPYLFVAFSKLRPVDPKVDHILFGYFKGNSEKLSISDRERVLVKIFNYFNQKQVPFNEKIFILSWLIHLRVDLALRTLMQVLLRDSEYIDYHYNILIQALLFISQSILKPYDEIYLERRILVDNLAKHYRMSGDYSVMRKDKHIAILYDQLLSYSHAPTKVIVNYLKSIQKNYPEYKIKLFVEDNFYTKEEENMFPYGFTTAISMNCLKEHSELLPDVEIYYSDVAKTKKQRVQKLVEEIINFSPEVILTTSDISISRAILYPYFPIVYLSMGAMNFATLADVYLYGKVKQQEVLDINEKFSLLDPQALYNFTSGFEITEPRKIINRSDYRLSEEDFVCITVGARLSGELTPEYIDRICGFLQENCHAKWLIVGPHKISYLYEKYVDLIDKQIIFQSWEEDLLALYKICDVYLNPLRRGGALSVAMAMSQGLPIVISSMVSDGLEFVGEENSAGDSLDDYVNEINRLYRDEAYRKAKGKQMLDLIKNFTYEKSVEKLFHSFDLAKERFKQRLVK